MGKMFETILPHLTTISQSSSAGAHICAAFPDGGWYLMISQMILGPVEERTQEAANCSAFAIHPGLTPQ